MPQMFEYEVWSPSAPDKLYNIDGFSDGDFYTKKKLTEQGNLNCMCFFSCGVHRWCTMCLRADGDHTMHTTYSTFVTFDFGPSFISRLIADSELEQIK